MWELDCEESWELKNWCFWTVVLEKTVESPLDHREIQPVHCKGDRSSVFFGRNDAKAETPILWPPHVTRWLIGKDYDAGRDWGPEKGTTEDEMAGWHHRLDGCEFEWTPGVGDGQGGLACCDSWGRNESDTTEWLNWTELHWIASAQVVHMMLENYRRLKTHLEHYACEGLQKRKCLWVQQSNTARKPNKRVSKGVSKGDHHRESGLLSICREVVPGCVRAVSHSLSSPCRLAETSYWKRGHEWSAYEEDFTYSNVNSTSINSCRREP